MRTISTSFPFSFFSNILSICFESEHSIFVTKPFDPRKVQLRRKCNCVAPPAARGYHAQLGRFSREEYLAQLVNWAVTCERRGLDVLRTTAEVKPSLLCRTPGDLGLLWLYIRSRPGYKFWTTSTARPSSETFIDCACDYLDEKSATKRFGSKVLIFWTMRRVVNMSR